MPLVHLALGHEPEMKKIEKEEHKTEILCKITIWGYFYVFKYSFFSGNVKLSSRWHLVKFSLTAF